jgi:Uma2 family endonuclease
MVLTISKDTFNIPSGCEITLRYQSWQDYEYLLNLRPDHSKIKIGFNAILKEIRLMSPLPLHGNQVSVLTDLVKILLKHNQLDWHSFDPITLKKSPFVGLEPDHCFYIKNSTKILGKERIDLTIDPPPDLVIEVDLTSTTKIDDYVAISSPEVWIYRQEQLLIYLFANSQYNLSQKSNLFPDINVCEILPQFVEKAWHFGSSIALKEFEQFLFS